MFNLTIVNRILRNCHSWLARQYVASGVWRFRLALALWCSSCCTFYILVNVYVDLVVLTRIAGLHRPEVVDIGVNTV